MVPQIVIEEAQDLIEYYGNTLEYRGMYKDCEIYQFVFPENKETGFPVIYLYDAQTNHVLEISEFRALDILEELSQSKS